MPLVKKLIKIGDSRAVILPKPFLDQLALDAAHAEVDLTLEVDRIIVAPHRDVTDAAFHTSARRVDARRRSRFRRRATR